VKALNTFIILIVISFQSFATSTIPVEVLTHEQAYCMGFRFTQIGDELIKLKYPIKIQNKWEPISSSVTYNLNETSVFYTKTAFVKSHANPTILFGFSDSISAGGDADLSLKYECTVNDCPKINQKLIIMKSVVAHVNANTLSCSG
jgi:hypothetical protein